MAVKNNTLCHTELVDAHLPLIRHIARGLSRTLPPSFPVEDLVQEGVIGLLRAATQYNPAAHQRSGFPKPVPFVCFARKRIRGAMLDAVTGRHYTAGTCLPLSTGENEDDAPGVACAPTVANQERDAHTREQLLKTIAATTWLSADQRRILSMRYGSAEMTMPAIAKAMGHSLRWVAERHSEAIAELRFRTGVHGSQAPRRYSGVPKSSKVIPTSAAAALEADRRKNLDELGELDQFFAPLKSKLTRQTNLRKWARELYDDADATRGFEASGDRFTVLIGPRSNVSSFDIPALIKKVGVKLFGTFAQTTLKDLAEHVSADVAASVTSVAQTGSRTVTSYERGTPAAPAKKAA
jgi:RNA polymerase sigma factor (sigma-70 family)